MLRMLIKSLAIILKIPEEQGTGKK